MAPAPIPNPQSSIRNGESPTRNPQSAIRNEILNERNAALLSHLNEDYDHLGRQLARRPLGHIGPVGPLDPLDIDELTAKAASFRVTIPSWGVATGGTRFALFPGPGEPRNIFEKLEDCAVINGLICVTPAVSVHIPWDRPENPAELRLFAEARGLAIDSVNSNTFQDQPGQAHSYKFGSLSHTDRAVRDQAIAHNIECLALGQKLGARALTIWIGDGGNFPGQIHFRRALDRYLESLREIYASLPGGWRLFLEHKLYEPAFYSTVVSDWGTSYHCACELGDQAYALVDLGHHAPSVNVEQIVARLIQFSKLGGFHFNDSQYGDDDLDAGSIKPFQLFLIFNELVDAALERVPGFDPAFMLDQSHNVTDPIESLMTSAMELVRAYVQAHLVDREALDSYQRGNDPLMALGTLKQAFQTDVSPILAMARYRAGGAIDPVGTYRASRYRQRVHQERPAEAKPRAGIV